MERTELALACLCTSGKPNIHVAHEYSPGGTPVVTDSWVLGRCEEKEDELRETGGIGEVLGADLNYSRIQNAFS